MSLCNSCEDVFMFQSLRSDLAFSLDKLYFFVFLYIFVFVVGDICFSVWGQAMQVSNAGLVFSLDKSYFFVFLFLFCICGGDIYIFVSASGVRLGKSQMQS